MWGCTYDALFLCMNAETLKSLSEEYQQIIRECAAEACAYQKEINRAGEADQLEAFKEAGMVVTERDDMDIDNIVAAVQPVYDEYEDTIGSDLLSLFQS